MKVFEALGRQPDFGVDLKVIFWTIVFYFNLTLIFWLNLVWKQKKKLSANIKLTSLTIIDYIIIFSGYKAQYFS